MSKSDKYQSTKLSNGPNITWQAFAKNNAIATPQNLNEDIWKGIKQKRVQKRRIIYSTISAAASLLIMFMIYVNSFKSQSHQQKEALLTEALEMFSKDEQAPTKSQLLYEDELIVIYAQSN